MQLSYRLYVPAQWKVAEIIMNPKPGKPLEEVISYRPSIPPTIMSKIFENAVLKRLLPVLEKTGSYRAVSLDFDSNTVSPNKYSYTEL
jgi:hypothetical protein